MDSTASWGSSAEFVRFCGRVGLELEEFQLRIVEQVFDGRRELLVIIPRGNGKTTLFAALALYHLIKVPFARVIIAASATNQALLAYDHILRFCRRHPSLEKSMELFPGYQEVRFPKNGGKIKVVSSDAGRAHGLEITLALCDELHAHPKDDLYVALKTALGKRPEAQLVTITTAGHDETRVLARLRTSYLEDGELLERPHGDERLTVSRFAAANSVMFEWACTDTDDLDDPDVLKLANPATFVSRDFLAEQIASPGLTAWERARYHGNVWTPTFESWLPPGAWDTCFEPSAELPDGPLILGVDVGVAKDSSAVVALGKRDDGRWAVHADIWKPEGDTLDLAVIEQRIRDWGERVSKVVYDPWSFLRSAQMLQHEGFLMIEFPMNNARTVPASARLYEAINRQELVHDGDPVLKSHVESGIKTDTDRGWRLSKGKAKRQIDGLMALLIAFAEAEVASPSREAVAIF